MVILVTTMTVTVTTMTMMSVYVLIFLASHHFLCYHAIFFLCVKKFTFILCFGHTVAHVLHLQIQIHVVFLWQCATIHSTYTFLSCREISDIKMGSVFCSVLPVLQPLFFPLPVPSRVAYEYVE